MHIYLAIFELVFLQQEKSCKNEVHWIMFYNYQSKSTDIHLGWLIYFFRGFTISKEYIL